MKRLPVVRPKTRGECADVPRPCPYVSCRYHLLFNFSDDGRMWVNHPRGKALALSLKRALKNKRKADDRMDEAAAMIADAISSMRETCALDVADRGSMTVAEISKVLGISDKHVESVELRAKRKIKAPMALLMVDAANDNKRG